MRWSLNWFAWAVAIVCLNLVDAKDGQQPHIVFVLADDYGFHDIGYHGSYIKTPNLDRLANNGVKLENYYVQPICSPSRAQFLSGRYSIHTGFVDGIIGLTETRGLPLDHPTLADKLKEVGYSTHCVGKWHLGHYRKEYLPNNRGFDTFYGYYTGQGDHYNHTAVYSKFGGGGSGRPGGGNFGGGGGRGGGGGGPRVGKGGKFVGRKPITGGKPYLDLHDQDQPVWNETGHYSTHLYTEKAIERIRNHDKSQPMFLYLAYQTVHTPLQVPEEYLQAYGHVQDDNYRVYAAMTAAMDEGVGNVTQALMDTGMWNNTVFVFSTDNGGNTRGGGANNAPLKGQKFTYWEGGVRGIGFVHSPYLKSVGTINQGLMDISDWYPTFLRLAGGSLNGTEDYLDGFDQWTAISEGASSPREELVYTLDPRNVKQGTPSYNHTFDVRVQAAIRSGDWKLLTGSHSNGVYYPYNGEQIQEPADKMVWLYNITADPFEHNEVSAQNPEVVNELLDKLVEYQKTVVYGKHEATDNDPNPALHGGVWGPWVP